MRLSQHRLGNSRGLALMCLQACVLTVQYVMSEYVWVYDYLNLHTCHSVAEG